MRRPSRKLDRGRLCFAVASALLCLTNLWPARDASALPSLQSVDLENRTEASRVSILVEVGELMPPTLLLELNHNGNVTLEIVSGTAEFLYPLSVGGELNRLRKVEYQASWVELPTLYAGASEFQESVLKILVDGVPLGEAIRIATLAPGLVRELWLSLQALEPAVLEVDENERSVIYDPLTINYSALEVDVEDLLSRPASCGSSSVVGEDRSRTGKEDFLDRAVGGIYEEGDYRCPILVWYRPKPTDPPFGANNCLSNLKVFGSVEFVGVSPPSGFSVKPEFSSILSVPATSIVNLVDGLYRSSWGCGVALKIPDNVVARVFSVDASCCRGLVAVAAGVTCTWLDVTTLRDWPDCPL